MKKNIILYIVCSIAFFNSHAQVSGYMGKRFSIGYSNYFLPSILGPKVNGTSASDKIGINTTHCVNLDYIIKERTSFCLSLQTQKLGVNNVRYYNVEYVDPFGTNNYGSYQYNPKPFRFMQLKTYSVGLGFKFFASGSLAPIGKYKKVELLLLFSNLTYPKNAFEDTGLNDPYTRTNIGTGDYSFSTFALTYTMGRSRVLFDRIVLDYGLRFGATPAGFFAFLNSDGDFSSNNLTPEKTFRQDTNMRLFRQQLVNLHIGISFLAF